MHLLIKIAKDDSYYYVVRAENHKVLATSETYSSFAACRRAAMNFVKVTRLAIRKAIKDYSDIPDYKLRAIEKHSIHLVYVHQGKNFFKND